MRNFSIAQRAFALLICLTPSLALGDERHNWAADGPRAQSGDNFPAKLFNLSLQGPAESGGGYPYFGPEFGFSIGYAKLELLDASGGPMSDEDAFRMDFRYSFSPIQKFSALRLGFGFGFDFAGSGLDNGAVIINDGQIIVISSGQDQTLTMFEPEVQLSLRLGNTRFYVEPGISGGYAFGYYRIADYYYYYSSTDYDSWSSTFYGRGFVRVAFGIPGGAFGLEGSYLRGGRLDFADNIAGDFEEMYIGVFGSLSY